MDVESISTKYAFNLIERWADLVNSSENYRANLIERNSDPDVVNHYISKLTNFWGELYPKVKGSSYLKSHEEAFLDFEPYYFAPENLLKDPEKIFRLQKVMREIVEKVYLNETLDTKMM